LTLLLVFYRLVVLYRNGKILKTDMCDLPPYVDRCPLIRLEKLAERRVNACVMFIFEILSGRVNSSNLLSLISINARWYHTRAENFLRIDFYRTNYGVHELLNGAVVFCFPNVCNLILS
jgi:hypothetical protein